MVQVRAVAEIPFSSHDMDWCVTQDDAEGWEQARQRQRLVAATFRTMFPDSYQFTLPVHDHMVCCTLLGPGHKLIHLVRAATATVAGARRPSATVHEFWSLASAPEA